MRVNTRETDVALPAKPTLTVVGDEAHSTVVGGSTADIRLNCSASRIEEAKAGRHTNIYADRGTALHHVVEHALIEDAEDPKVLKTWSGVVINMDDMVHDIEMTPDLLMAKAIPALRYFDKVVPLSAEFWIERKHGMVISDDEDWLPADEAGAVLRAGFNDIQGAFGTGDVFFRDEASGRAGVIDWKFGDGIMVSAHDNNQMRFYLTLGIMNGLLPVQDSYEAHIFQPIEGKEWEDWIADAKGTYSLDDLVRFNRELADAIHGPVLYNAGEHCTKCKGKLTCDAYQAMLTTAVSTDIQGMTAQELAQQLRLIPAYEAWVKDIKAAGLRNAQQGVDIPGFGLEPAQGNRAWRDETKAERALGRMGLETYVRRVVKTISPAQAIERLRDIGTEAKRIERFERDHVFRPDNGEKLVQLKDGMKAAGNAMKRLATALKARGH